MRLKKPSHINALHVLSVCSNKPQYITSAEVIRQAIQQGIVICQRGFPRCFAHLLLLRVCSRVKVSLSRTGDLQSPNQTLLCCALSHAYHIVSQRDCLLSMHFSLYRVVAEPSAQLLKCLLSRSSRLASCMEADPHVGCQIVPFLMYTVRQRPKCPFGRCLQGCDFMTVLKK